MKKKLLQGLFMFGTAVAVCFGLDMSEASAATLPEDGVEIDCNNQKLTVVEDAAWQLKNSDATDREILCGVSTYKAATATREASIKTASWEVYETTTRADGAKTVTIDLSSLNRAKDNYLQIRGDKNTDPITIMIPKINSSIKAKFDALAGTVGVVKTKATDTTDISGYAYEYRTQYSDWTDFSLTDSLEMYQMRGAVMYIRVKASETVDISDCTQADREMIAGFEVCKVGNFPGKELKFTVPKRPNAPKIAANYTANTVTIPRNAQYRINLPDAAGLGSWQSANTDTSMKLDLTKAEYAELYAKGGDIEAQTVATATKPASRIARLTVKAQETVKTVNADAAVTADSLIGTSKVVSEAGDEIISVEAMTPVKDRNGAITSYKLKFKNKSAAVYQVVVTADDSVPAFNAAGIKTIAAATTTTPEKTVTLTGFKPDQYVYIRKAGNNGQSAWTTAYVLLGKVAEKQPEIPEGGEGSDEVTP